MNYDYPEEQKAAWSRDPDSYLAYRREVETELNSRFPLYVDHTPEQKAAREYGVKEMTTKLGGKKELLEALLPDFAVGSVSISCLYRFSLTRYTAVEGPHLVTDT